MCVFPCALYLEFPIYLPTSLNSLKCFSSDWEELPFNVVVTELTLETGADHLNDGAVKALEPSNQNGG